MGVATQLSPANGDRDGRCRNGCVETHRELPFVAVLRHDPTLESNTYPRPVVRLDALYGW
jgi:hypothetical protein